QVLLKSDGYPTYHLGVVVDDHAMNITHIIRAEEWITSTPKHVLLYQAFGWEMPIFAHVPILRNPDRSKLSKRKNPVWASWYLEQGFLPEAILNFLALMGWSHPEEKEIFSLDEFISLFDLKDVKPAGPIFDIQKLEWMNGVYIRNHQISNLKSQIIQQDPRLEKLDDDLFDQLLPLAQTRMKKLNEFYELTKYIFEKPQRELSEKEKEITEKLKNKLLTIEQWSNETILITLKQVMEEEGVKMSVLYKVLTGSEHGLPLSDVLAILGKERVLTLLS
ncbi:MAG: glutamate--tRNA ligase family protein, partial [Patescibacteria group bacterium]